MTQVLSKIWIKDKCASLRKIPSNTLFLEVTYDFRRAASSLMLKTATQHCGLKCSRNFKGLWSDILKAANKDSFKHVKERLYLWNLFWKHYIQICFLQMKVEVMSFGKLMDLQAANCFFFSSHWETIWHVVLFLNDTHNLSRKFTLILAKQHCHQAKAYYWWRNFCLFFSFFYLLVLFFYKMYLFTFLLRAR